ncbi:MAG: FHA domain-containing protein [Planctomycetes bacterium]|nr:FHA domain-containing protein [Planctomycetota bacterium]
MLHRSGEETRFPLASEIVSIGRSPANAIRLDDSSISKRHCLLVKTPAGVKMLDLESTNGTFVNDRLTREQVLKEGDRLRVGSYEFRFAAAGFVPPPLTVLPGEMAVGHPFADLLVRELRRTPFWLVSLIVHLALLLTLWDADFLRVPLQEPVRPVTARTAFLEDSDLEELVEERIEEEIPETEVSIDPLEEAIPDRFAERARPEDDADPSETPIGLGGGARRRLADGFGLGPADLGLNERDLEGAFGDYLKDMRGRGLDVAIVFDSTGSMQGIIDQVRAQIHRMNLYISALVPGNYRLAMATYRDRGDDYVVRVEPLTHDFYQILIFIESVHAAGGGDIPEAVHEGLQAATRKLRWRKNAHKVVLLFGDAPPHDRDLPVCRNLASQLRREGGVIHTIFTEVGAREEALSEPDRKAVEAFRSIARYGGGSFSFLDQEVNIVRAVQSLIFEKRFQDDVDRLSQKLDFGWKGRMIDKKVRARDLEFLIRHFRRANLHPLITDGLIRLEDPRIEPEMQRILEDASVPAFNRSAARYVLLRRSAPSTPAR